ncbi:MAG: transglutaminase domain-containing protein, partial [Candidatus Marinimicrobia bacterium]|nr:transglutaminase domain-containing protein [Candidatus Neomarinimicrobiota bacterium]
MKYKIKIKSVIFSAIILILFSCTQINRVEVPENVQTVLEKSGDNRKELKKVINVYQHPEDSLKLKAAFFLISNMEEKGFIRYTVVGSTEKDIGFNVLNYPDYNKMISGWDSLEDMYGKLHQKKEEIVIDYNTITSGFLINNIDLAFKAWTENPWARHIKFDQFCEYILPYRSTNEPLENWRTYFYDKYSWVKDSVKQKNDPIEASILINNDIKSWFTFDPRFYRQSTDQGLSNMLKNKIGRCEDMTNLTIFAMRSMGIPVMSDFTPYWAKTGNNHAWNAIIDTTGKVIIFMGAESNP